MTGAQFATVPEAIAAVARGDLVVVVDDEARENEGDLVMAANFATTDKVAFLVRHTSGLICAPLTEARAEDMNLPLMVQNNTESRATAFTHSVDVIRGTSTGISAADRALTLAALANPVARPEEFARPGHIFPLRARPGGVLKRAGHTEAAVDLATMAGAHPVGAIAEIVRGDGAMARLPDLVSFAKRHRLKLLTIADLVAHRYRTESLVYRVGASELTTRWGRFSCIVYRDTVNEMEHMALFMGQLDAHPVLARVHSECLTGDVFGSARCDCGTQLHDACEAIATAGAGVIVYLRGHEGRGVGLGHKISAYSLQDKGFDTVDANIELGLPVDDREYGVGAQILLDLGARRLRLMSNNPAKYSGLDGYGLEIVERVPLPPRCTPENIAYLRTKQRRLGHTFDLDAPGVFEA